MSHGWSWCQLDSEYGVAADRSWGILPCGRSAISNMEAVRATLEAYAAGKIKLGKMSRDTKKSVFCEAPSVIANNEGLSINPRSYTRLQIAEFLGWTIGRERNNAKQLDFRCKVAFHCLEAVERGLDPKMPKRRGSPTGSNQYQQKRKEGRTAPNSTLRGKTATHVAAIS